MQQTSQQKRFGLLAGALAAICVAGLLGATPAPAAPAAGTADIQDVDGFLDASEVSSGVPAVWDNTDASVVSTSVWFEAADGSIPADCGPFAVGASGTGAVNPACAANLPEGEFTFRVVWTDGLGETTEATDTSVKDTVGPLVTAALADGGDGEISPFEADAGVELAFTVDEAGPEDVSAALAPSGGSAPTACSFSGLARDAGSVFFAPDCLAALPDGPVDATVTVADALGNVTAQTASSELDRRLRVSLLTGNDAVANGAETASGLGVLLTPDAVFADEVLTATVTATDRNGASVSTPEPVELAATSSQDVRTVRLDVSSLADGPVTVTAVLTSSLGTHSDQVSALLDDGAPVSSFETADGTAIVRVCPPVASTFLCFSSATIKGGTADGASPVQFVHYRVVNKDTGDTWWAPVKMSARDAQSVTWSIDMRHFEIGENEVSVVAQDEAGNLSAPVKLTVLVLV